MHNSTNRIVIVYRKKHEDEKQCVPDNDPQFQHLCQHLPKSRNAKILDAGCGSGKYASKISELGNYRIYGVDLFEQTWRTGFDYRQASIENLPFSDSFFDFVYSNSVIYYLEDPERSIKEFYRVLKPQGNVFITAHTKYSLFTVWRLLKRDLNLASMEHLYNIRILSANEYKRMLQMNGFDIVWIDGFCTKLTRYDLAEQLIRIFSTIVGSEFLPITLIRFSKNPLFAKIRSIIGYHCVLIARKRG